MVQVSRNETGSNAIWKLKTFIMVVSNDAVSKERSLWRQLVLLWGSAHAVRMNHGIVADQTLWKHSLSRILKLSIAKASLNWILIRVHRRIIHRRYHHNNLTNNNSTKLPWWARNKIFTTENCQLAARSVVAAVQISCSKTLIPILIRDLLTTIVAVVVYLALIIWTKTMKITSLKLLLSIRLREKTMKIIWLLLLCRARLELEVKLYNSISNQIRLRRENIDKVAF